MLEGRIFLILEDEPVVGLVLEDMIGDAGGSSIYAERVPQALDFIETARFDAAILDVNVHGHKSYSVARALAARGIPFIFATGYGSTLHPEEFLGIPTVTKPYRLPDIEKAVETARSLFSK